VEDSYGLAVGLEIRPDSVLLKANAAFGRETVTGKLFAAERAAPLEKLGTLPKAQALYTAGRFSPELSRATQMLSREFAVGEDEEKAAQAIERHAEELALASADGWLSAGSGPRGNLQVLFPQNPAKLTESY